MGTLIIKLGGEYLYWYTMADGPSFSRTLEELRAEVKEQNGTVGLREMDEERLPRVHAKGTSCIEAKNVDDTIWLNRAGPNEEPLHREEIIEFYVRRKKQPTKTALAKFRKGLARCGSKCPSIENPDGGAGFCERCWGTGFVRKVTRVVFASNKKVAS